MKNITDYLTQLHQKYEKVSGVVFFLVGFVFDLFTLGRIDDFSNIIIQFLYLLMAYLIFISFKIDKINYENKFVQKLFEYRNEIFHFVVGSLLSAFTLFYFKSSNISTSFVFLVILLLLLLLNEFEMFQHIGMTFKALLLKICSLSFFIYLFPIVFATNSSFVFYLALIVSLIFTFLMKRFFEKKMNIENTSINKEFLYPRILVVVAFLMMYLMRIFPPLPLHLSYIGVFHQVEKKYPEYHLSYQKPWWQFWAGPSDEISLRKGDKLYLFFRVFSPGSFKGSVKIQWNHLDEKSDNWVQYDEIPIAIEGGRESGYRGYISKSNYTTGRWLVQIKTDNDLVLGEKSFEIHNDTSTEERNFHKMIDK